MIHVAAPAPPPIASIRNAPNHAERPVIRLIAAPAPKSAVAVSDTDQRSVHRRRGR